MKSLTYFFHIKRKILADFRICISVPLKIWRFVFKDFAKFTGKHLRQNLCFNKLCRHETYKLIKKETLAQLFSCEVCNIFKNTSGGCFWKKRLKPRCFTVNLANILTKPFLKNSSGWLLPWSPKWYKQTSSKILS